MNYYIIVISPRNVIFVTISSSTSILSLVFYKSHSIRNCYFMSHNAVL